MDAQGRACRIAEIGGKKGMVKDIKFSAQAETYLAALASRRRKPVKPTTIATFRTAIGIAKPVLGTLPVCDIESENLRQLVEHLVADKYAPNTIRLVIRTVKKAIASAVDGNGNPLIAKVWNADHVDEPEVIKQESELPTAAQIESVLHQAPPIVREFIAVQAATGLRRGEMLGLNAEDFNPVNLTLHVARTRSYFGETSPKTKSGERIVDLHPSVAALLARMLAGRTTGRLFDASIDTIRRAFERIGLKSHSLRHFRYTHLQVSAVPNAIRDYWIGHSAAGMEKIYGHMAQNTELRRNLAADIGVGFKLPRTAAPKRAERQEIALQVTA